MTIRTIIVAAVASLSFTGTGLGQFWAPSSTELTAPDSGTFGSSVAIDGDTCVIGAAGTSGTGSAYVFTNTNGTWSQVAELTATDGASYDNFGYSVAIDGDTCVIGALGTNSSTGSAYVFTNTNGTWSQVAELTATDGA
ncbi:MAG: FG-GAP repeat protein, partial [Phycisphaerales bacterium]|nr:FG-GAP repeat protein [Phycisphaerales bacterium]